MEAMGIYSLKAALILFLFWTVYQLFLRKETFLQFNRFFLLSGLLTALFLPLVKVHYPVVEAVAPMVVPLTEEWQFPTQITEVSVFSWESFLLVIYVLGICILSLITLIGLGKLGQIIWKNGYQTFSDYYLVDSSPYKTSFSFFRFIFLSESLNDQEKKIVLSHEETHIRQKHWMDLLLSYIFKTLWWFNPLVWLYEKAIRENHEYLADSTVLHNYSQKDYFSVLANQWFRHSLFPLTNSFNYSTQLKRIKMMKKNISNPAKKLSVLFLLPALAIFLWAFAEPKYQLEETQPQKVLYVVDGVVLENVSLETITSENIAALIAPNEIENITVLKDQAAVKVYGEKGKNGAILITTKKSDRDVEMQDENEKNRPQKDLQNHLSDDSIRSSVVVRYEEPQSPTHALYIVDGVTVDATDVFSLQREKIETVVVLKDTSAVKIYGEKGKNGVILITTK